MEAPDQEEWSGVEYRQTNVTEQILQKVKPSTAKKAKIGAKASMKANTVLKDVNDMDSQFDALWQQLSEARAKRNTDFYDEHNNNYYKHKGKSQLKRDQKQTSVALLKSHKE